jgi:Fe-S-cluster containining protein
MNSRKIDNRTFMCDRCGLCCKVIQCEKYDEKTKRCTVYRRRPDICNVRKAHKMVAPELTLQQWYEKNYEACRQLKDNLGKILDVQLIKLQN